ncbi:hypothetical protein ACFL3G_07625 [Planctomycetota bacterium]
MQELRQSTEIKVRVGPFLDRDDGITPETGVTLGGADEAELLKHNGVATVSISGNTWAAISSCDGYYDLTLSTTDTNTLGQLSVIVQDDSVCLPVRNDFMVITAEAWDSKYSSNTLETDVALVRKILANIAIQNKSTGAVVHYDDDDVTPILTLTPTDGASEITRTPS